MRAATGSTMTALADRVFTEPGWSGTDRVVLDSGERHAYGAPLPETDTALATKGDSSLAQPASASSLWRPCRRTRSPGSAAISPSGSNNRIGSSTIEYSSGQITGTSTPWTSNHRHISPSRLAMRVPAIEDTTSPGSSLPVSTVAFGVDNGPTSSARPHATNRAAAAKHAETLTALTGIIRDSPDTDVVRRRTRRER